MPVDFVVYTNTSPRHMARQLQRNPGGPPQYGAWLDAGTAARAMTMAFDHFGREIYSWQRDPGRPSFIRDFTVPFDVGAVLTATERSAAEAEHRQPRPVITRTFRIELRSSPNSPGFYVVRTDPLPPLPDHGVAVSTVSTYEVAKNDLSRQGGHAIRKHVAVTLAEAISRLDNNPDVRATGAFNDLQTLDDVVRATVTSFGPEIAGWLTNSSDSMPFVREMVFPDVVGWVLDRDALNRARAEGRPVHPEMARGARLVLRKSNEYPEGYYVVTAYSIVV